MNQKIKLVEKAFNEESFDVDHIYEYKFSLHCALEKNELMFGNADDLIELLKEDFEIALRKYIKNDEE